MSGKPEPQMTRDVLLDAIEDKKTTATTKMEKQRTHGRLNEDQIKKTKLKLGTGGGGDGVTGGWRGDFGPWCDLD